MIKANIKPKKKYIFFKRSKSNNYIKENCKSDSYSSTSYSNNDNPSLFLDYTFKENKNNLYNECNFINSVKAQNYNYELGQTFDLNIDLLLAYFNSSKIHHNNEIIQLLNDLKDKEKYKRETKIKIKQKCNQLISKNDYANIFYEKINNQINQYNIKIKNKINEIEESKNYISDIKSRFCGAENYIYKIRFKSEGKKGIHKKNKLKKFINSNNKYQLKIINYKKDIKKLKENISELKKDNKLSRTQSKLYKMDKPDINLIRVVEFYIRIIRSISMRNKILKNSINSLSKTLQFLDLNQILNFNQYKRNRQKSSFEIEFSDLDDTKYEINENIKYEKGNNRIKNFIDFNKVLK